MSGWYELSSNDKGQHFFVLKAGNAETILRSEQYESKAAAENGIASVQKNSPLPFATSTNMLAWTSKLTKRSISTALSTGPLNR